MMNRDEIGKLADIVIQDMRTSEALAKQKPMKPVYDYRYQELGCVYCGNQVSGWEETPNYCPQCGQKIDWTED